MYLHELFPKHFAIGGYVPGKFNYAPGQQPAGQLGPVQGQGFNGDPGAQMPGPDTHKGPFYQNTYNATAPQSNLNFTGAKLDHSGYGGSIDQAQQGYGSLIGMLQGQANGTGPNPALAQLHQTTDRNIAQAHALAASNSNNAGALRNISRQASEANADASGQAATLKAQQQLAATGQLGSALQGLYGTSGQLQNQQNANNLTNWIDPQKLALEQAQGNQTAYGNAQGLNAQASLANLAAAQQFQGQAANATAGLLNGVGSAATSYIGSKSGGGYTGTTSDGQDVSVGDVNTDSPSYSGSTESQPNYDFFRGGQVHGYADGGTVDKQSIFDLLGESPPTVSADVGEPTGVKRMTPSAIDANAFKRAPMDSGGGGGMSPWLVGGLALGKGFDIGTQILSGGKKAPASPINAPGTTLVPDPSGIPRAVPIPDNQIFPDNMGHPVPGLGPSLGLGGGSGAAHGGMISMLGGGVPGRAAYGGDNRKNDTVPTMLSPGEIVLPRSVTQDDNAAEKAAAFVEAIKKSKRKAA